MHFYSPIFYLILYEIVFYFSFQINMENINFKFQAASLDSNKVLTTCELYSGPSLLVPEPEYEQLELEQEQLELEQEQELEQLPEELVLDGHKHMPVSYSVDNDSELL